MALLSRQRGPIALYGSTGYTGKLTAAELRNAKADFVISGLAMQNPRLAPLAERAFVAGLDRILLISGIVAAIGAVVVFLLVRPQDFVEQPAGAEQPAEAAAVGV